MEIPFYVKFFAAQGALALAVIMYLRGILNRNLTNTAIRSLELWEPDDEGSEVRAVIIVSHKSLNNENRKRIEAAVVQNCGKNIKAEYRVDKSLYGGLVVRIDNRVVNLSIKERLRQARR